MIEKCCFCVPLRVATIITGILHLVAVFYETFFYTSVAAAHIFDVISVSAAVLLIVGGIKVKYSIDFISSGSFVFLFIQTFRKSVTTWRRGWVSR